MGILFVLFRGRYIDCLYVWKIQVCFVVSNLGGELVCIFVVFLFSYFYFPHMRLCVLFSILGNIQVDSVVLLSTLATDG